MKIKEKTKDCQLLVKAKASIGESIEQSTMDRFARSYMYMRGFMKPMQIKKNQVLFEGPTGISLCDKFKKPINKREFLFILEHTVVVIKNLDNHKLPLEALILDLHNVYMNEATMEVNFLYIPTGQPNVPFREFLRQVIYSVKPSSEEDMEYVSRFKFFLDSREHTDSDSIEQFVNSEDRSVVQIINARNMRLSGNLSDKPPYPVNDPPEYEEDTCFLDEEENDEEKTSLLVDDDDDDDEGTILLNEQIHYPTLHRVRTDEVININGIVFRIGRDQRYVDYCIQDNAAISGSHADIITRTNKFFIIDQKSKNHVFLNGNRLPVRQEIELNDGDQIRLGDEEFVFNI